MPGTEGMRRWMRRVPRREGGWMRRVSLLHGWEGAVCLGVAGTVWLCVSGGGGGRLLTFDQSP